MSSESEIIKSEIPEVETIIHNECWLEAERRKCPVDRHDEVIIERVAQIILGGVGSDLRKKYGA